MKIKTQWDLNGLFYKSLKDPRLMRDVEAGDKAVAVFVKKYQKDKSWLTSPKRLAQALLAYEALILKSKSSPIMYAMYRKELDSKDKEAEALQNRLETIYTKRGNTLLFFDLELAKVSPATQKLFLKASELKEFRYWLTQLFENAKHNLSEKEEKLMSLLSDVSFGRWVQAVENIVANHSVTVGDGTTPINEGLAKISSLPKKERRVLWDKLMQELKNISEIAESELNAIVTRKKITDELRGFKEPYDATIIGYENDRKSVLALIKAVTDNFSISQRFYKVKAKMLGEKMLTYADRAASVGRIEKKIPFTEAAEIVRKTFVKLHPRYGEVFERLLSNGQVDVYPKAGKTGGAYCSHSVGEPTMLLLNHIENANSLLTLAHEMGHAIHSERSKTQRPMYQGYSTVTAETASTFFERAAFESLVEKLSEKERIIALHDRIQDDVQTIFRQIAFFNFELGLHTHIREKGLMPKEAIAKLLNEETQRYVGPAVHMAPEDGYFFVAVSHFRRFFYVYSYAYGQLVSRALWEKVKKDPSFMETIDKYFLTVGGSKSPEAIFADCGLDLYKPKVFLEGLKSIENDVKELEKAVAKKR